MADLYLAVRGIYFNQAKMGIKVKEFRLANDYWKKSLDGREYENIIYTFGYPKRDDHERRLVIPYRGYQMETITHDEFGSDPVEVFAIWISDISSG